MCDDAWTFVIPVSFRCGVVAGFLVSVGDLSLHHPQPVSRNLRHPKPLLFIRSRAVARAYPLLDVQSLALDIPGGMPSLSSSCRIL